MEVQAGGKRLMRALLVTLLVALLPAAGAQAANFTVSNTSDAPGTCPTPATCSLRQAVASADAAAGNDTISFNLPTGSIISLTEGTIIVDPATVSDALAINGPGAHALTLQRDSSVPFSSLIDFANGATTLSGVTLTAGNVGAFTAAATNNFSTAILNQVVVSGNTGDAGGGAGGSGGALANAGTLTISGSTISANSVSNAGTGQSGGALVNLGDVLIVNSTINANSVTGSGPDDGTIVNLARGSVTAVNTTIAGNSVQAGGGGIWNDATPGMLANTILAGNTSTAPNCVGAVTSRGYNVVGNDAGCTFVAAAGDQVGTGASPIDPLLGPLADNGGPTPTRALLAGSPAQDTGNPAAPSDGPAPASPALIPCATTDQRGFARPQFARCDIGAFEVAPAGTPPPPPPPPPPAFVSPDVDHFKCYAVVQKRFKRRLAKLRDQFATKTLKSRVRSTKRLCNPVRKDGSPVRRPKAHLVCYATRDDRKTTFAPRNVVVQNQFGREPLRVLRPESMCVPSLKRKGTKKKPPRKPNPAVSVDNFRCYVVSPIVAPRTVRLKDQFGTTSTAVAKLTRLCNPVKRNNAKIRRPDAHLVCYTIKDAKTFRTHHVMVRNPLGVAPLTVRKPQALCLPSLKTEVSTRAAAATSASAKRWAAAFAAPPRGP